MQMKSTKRHISMVSLVFLVLFSVLNVWAPVIQACCDEKSSGRN